MHVPQDSMCRGSMHLASVPPSLDLAFLRALPLDPRRSGREKREKQADLASRAPLQGHHRAHGSSAAEGAAAQALVDEGNREIGEPGQHHPRCATRAVPARPFYRPREIGRERSRERLCACARQERERKSAKSVEWEESRVSQYI